jgi:hypothetical protein
MAAELSPMDIMSSMITHAIGVSGNNRRALVVVLIAMARAIHELPGDNEPLLKWIEQTTKQFAKSLA